MATDKELLRQPFTNIRKREGKGKTFFDYIPAADITERLIDATDNEYEWSVTRLEFVSDGKTAFWLCEGKLTLPGLGTRSGVGTALAHGEESPKSCETDALKRAAVKFGVALHLYHKEGGPASPQGAGQAAGNGSARPGSCPMCRVTNGSPGPHHAPNCPHRTETAKAA